jgi:hypothetical protein
MTSGTPYECLRHCATYSLGIPTVWSRNSVDSFVSPVSGLSIVMPRAGKYRFAAQSFTMLRNTVPPLMQTSPSMIHAP